MKTLPLRSRTPALWAKSVLADPVALLNDHAYLEKKAALNVLDLLNRWPEGGDAGSWIDALAGVARDETQHLEQVSGLLAKRGGCLQRTHKNPYAADLRKLVRAGRGNEELADRLLVSALIEARSCERFDVLARTAEEPDLGGLYKSLGASEFGHYAVFVRLARLALPGNAVEARWQWMLDREADILARQPLGPRLHSGVP